MDLEAQSLNLLRNLVRELQDDNKTLKEKLKKTNIANSDNNVFKKK